MRNQREQMHSEKPPNFDVYLISMEGMKKVRTIERGRLWLVMKFQEHFIEHIGEI